MALSKSRAFPQRLKPELKTRAVIAALKRCTTQKPRHPKTRTQNQAPNRVFSAACRTGEGARPHTACFYFPIITSSPFSTFMA
jgi:hypothetical protein